MSRKGTKLKWTELMNDDVLECKRQALELVSSAHPPRYQNGRKKGYIQLMRELWEEKGYGHLGLKGQNLRDRASWLENHQDNLLANGSSIDYSTATTTSNSIFETLIRQFPVSLMLC